MLWFLSIFQSFFAADLLSLGLADNRISNEGASSFAELVRQTDTLQRITLSGNDIQDDGGSMLMAALSQNVSLQGLYLAGVSQELARIFSLSSRGQFNHN